MTSTSNRIVVLCAAFALLAPSVARAEPVTLQSAILGTTGRVGGTSLTHLQLVGWRFEIDQTIEVSEVGGHILGVDNGDIFAALIRLDSIESQPAGDPFLPEEIVASTLLVPPFPSAEFFTPLSATLEPGAYALVFGSGQFGATGVGAIPNPLEQLDIPPTTFDSYMFYSVPFFGQPPLWRGPLASHMRFVIKGTAVPRIPALGRTGIAVLALLLLAAVTVRRRA